MSAFPLCWTSFQFLLFLGKKEKWSDGGRERKENYFLASLTFISFICCIIFPWQIKYLFVPFRPKILLNCADNRMYPPLLFSPSPSLFLSSVFQNNLEKSFIWLKSFQLPLKKIMPFCLFFVKKRERENSINADAKNYPPLPSSTPPLFPIRSKEEIKMAAIQKRARTDLHQSQMTFWKMKLATVATAFLSAAEKLKTVISTFWTRPNSRRFL